jgi:peptidyl-prolyl cis-trans isomerase SurA
MRIATTLLLGAAALFAGASPILAQDDGFRRVPAVAPLPTTGKQALAVQAPKPAEKPVEKSTETPAPVPTMEAKNNDAGIPSIDATAAENPDDYDSIAATVNDESISDYEVRQRVSLYLATSGITQKLNDEQMKRIRGQILEKLEDEKVQLQEAVKKKITVSPVEVDKRINAMMAENHFTIQQLRSTLAQAGATEEALRGQITASIAWLKTVQDEYADRVNVTPDMVNAEMAKNAEGANKAHFHVLEIFLPVDNPEKDAKVKKDAEDIINQLHQGAPFSVVARQFSQHPTAATGGDIGWVYDGQMAPELNAAVSKLSVGMITDPIRSTGGYYVLALRERQEPLGTKIETAPVKTGPEGTLPLARLLFPVGPKPPKAELDQIMGIGHQITDHYQGCAQLEEVAKKLPGTVYMNLGDAKLEELSPQIQAAMKNSGPGDAAAPFQDEAGVEVIGRCDKRPEVKTAFVMPSRQQVEDELYQNQISTMARRYLRDLKRDSNIQVRDNSKPDALIR